MYVISAYRIKVISMTSHIPIINLKYIQAPYRKMNMCQWVNL